MYNIINFSKWWCDIKNNFDNHKIELKILEKFDKNTFTPKQMSKIEIKWINKLLPLSQKCDNTDYIIPLIFRDFNINNLKEKYKERLNKFLGNK